MVAPELAKERAAIEQLRRGMPSYATTLILQERPPDNPRPTFVHNRGEYLQPTERVEPAVLSILPSLAEGRPSQPAGSGALAGVAGQSAHGSRDDEPPVGHVLRPRPGPHHRGFRLPRASRPATPSCSTGSPWSCSRQGGSIEANAQVDRDECDLSAVIAGDSGIAGEGSGEPVAGPRAARPPGGGGDPGRGLARQRPARGASRRPERVPAAAARRHHRGDLRRPRLEGQPGRRPLSTRVVYLHQAHRPVRDGDDLRRTQRRGLRGPSRGFQHAIAGPDALERPGVPGGRAGAGPVDDRAAAGPSRSGSMPCSGAASPEPRIGTSCRSSRGSSNRRNGGSSSRSSTPPRSPAPDAGEANERAAWTVLAR